MLLWLYDYAKINYSEEVDNILRANTSMGKPNEHNMDNLEEDRDETEWRRIESERERERLRGEWVSEMSRFSGERARGNIEAEWEIYLHYIA